MEHYTVIRYGDKLDSSDYWCFYMFYEYYDVRNKPFMRTKLYIPFLVSYLDVFISKGIQGQKYSFYGG